MGGCAPQQSLGPDVYEQVNTMFKLRNQFEALSIEAYHLTKFYDIWTKVDLENTDIVTTSHLLALLGVQVTKYEIKTFSIFDSEKSGKITFREFVLASWNFLSLNKHGIALLTFDLYAGKNGKLSKDGITKILQDVYGSNSNTPMAVNVLQNIQVIEKDLSKAEFSAFCTKEKNFLYPAFSMQQKIRTHICGQMYWESVQHERERASNQEIGDYEYVGLHMRRVCNDRKFKEFVVSNKEDQGKRASSTVTLDVMEEYYSVNKHAGNEAVKKKPKRSSTHGNVKQIYAEDDEHKAAMTIQKSVKSRKEKKAAVKELETRREKKKTKQKDEKIEELTRRNAAIKISTSWKKKSMDKEYPADLKAKKKNSRSQNNSNRDSKRESHRENAQERSERMHKSHEHVVNPKENKPSLRYI